MLIVEVRLAPGGMDESIRGLANELPEHALRLAAVIAMMSGPGCEGIDSETFAQGVTLAEHYAGEALRLFDAGSVPPSIIRAEELWAWLRNTWCQPIVGLQHIDQKGPARLRTAAAAREAARCLVEHGLLVPVEEPTMIAGVKVREGFRLINADIDAELTSNNRISKISEFSRRLLDGEASK